MAEEIKAEGICLRSVEYGETDRIITLLTDEWGKLTVRAKGVSSPKSKLRHAAIPFSFGEYILAVKGEYYTLKTFDYKDAFTGVSDDLTRYFAGAAALEIADKLTEENVSVSAELARLLRLLMTLCYDGGDVGDFLLYLLDMLRLAGYRVSRGELTTDRDPKYFVFDVEEGCFRSSAIRSGYAVKMTAPAIRLLAAYADGEKAEGAGFAFAEIFAVLSQYVKGKTGKNLRALFELSDILRNGTTFGGV